MSATALLSVAGIIGPKHSVKKSHVWRASMPDYRAATVGRTVSSKVAFASNQRSAISVNS